MTLRLDGFWPRSAHGSSKILAFGLLLAGLSLAQPSSVAWSEPVLQQGATSAQAPAVTAWAASVRAALARRNRHVARKPFIQSGLASWYGHDFAGKRTSSGARFNPRTLTCAHRTLPLGTRVRVTSQTSGRSVVVTVNDRGPFAGGGRIIDLSRAAAVRLGMVQEGLNRVTVERVAAPAADVEIAQAAGNDTSKQAIRFAGRDPGGPAAGGR